MYVWQVIETQIAAREKNYICGPPSEIKFQSNPLDLEFSTEINGWELKRVTRLSVLPLS